MNKNLYYTIISILAGTATLITTFISLGISLEDISIELPNLTMVIPITLIITTFLFFGIGLIFLIG